MTRGVRIAWAFGAAVFLLYLSLSPFTIGHMGYTAEDMRACRQLAGTRPGPVQWPRNGAVALALQCPFVVAGDVLAGTADGGDRLLAVQPVLASALLTTLLFVWCTELAGSRAWGLTLALLAGFGTMIWPYAYIGLETTQSLSLLLAAYLALAEAAKERTPGRVLLFVVAAAAAVSAKSNGVMLIPAVAYLVWKFFRRPRTAALAGTGIVAIFCANAWVRGSSWERFGGTFRYVADWLAGDATSPLLHLVGFVGSPNKGLIVFAPVAVLGLLALPRALAANRGVAVFALLTFAGLAGGFSLLDVWADETWGPRYLHTAIAPLVLCLALARRGRPLRPASEAPLVAAAILGFGVSLLGTLFYYGTLAGAASRTAPAVIGTFQGDPLWNHVRFNARLLRVWLRTRSGTSRGPEFLEPGRSWNFADPSAAPPWTPVDLREFAWPQPFLLRSEVGRRPRLPFAAAGLAGLILLGWAWRSARSPDTVP